MLWREKEHQGDELGKTGRRNRRPQRRLSSSSSSGRSSTTVLPRSSCNSSGSGGSSTGGYCLPVDHIVLLRDNGMPETLHKAEAAGGLDASVAHTVRKKFSCDARGLDWFRKTAARDRWRVAALNGYRCVLPQARSGFASMQARAGGDGGCWRAYQRVTALMQRSEAVRDAAAAFLDSAAARALTPGDDTDGSARSGGGGSGGAVAAPLSPRVLALHFRPYPDTCLDYFVNMTTFDLGVAQEVCSQPLLLHRTVPLVQAFLALWAAEAAEAEAEGANAAARGPAVVFVMSHPRVRKTVSREFERLWATGGTAAAAEEEGAEEGTSPGGRKRDRKEARTGRDGGRALQLSELAPLPRLSFLDLDDVPPALFEAPGNGGRGSSSGGRALPVGANSILSVVEQQVCADADVFIGTAASSISVLVSQERVHAMWPEVERELVGAGVLNANSPVTLLDYPLASCFLHWKLLQAPEPPPVRSSPRRGSGASGGGGVGPVTLEELLQGAQPGAAAPDVRLKAAGGDGGSALHLLVRQLLLRRYYAGQDHGDELRATYMLEALPLLLEVGYDPRALDCHGMSVDRMLNEGYATYGRAAALQQRGGGCDAGCRQMQGAIQSCLRMCACAPGGAGAGGAAGARGEGSAAAQGGSAAVAGQQPAAAAPAPPPPGFNPYAPQAPQTPARPGTRQRTPEPETPDAGARQGKRARAEPQSSTTAAPGHGRPAATTAAAAAAAEARAASARTPGGPMSQPPPPPVFAPAAFAGGCGSAGAGTAAAAAAAAGFAAGPFGGHPPPHDGAGSSDSEPEIEPAPGPLPGGRSARARMRFGKYKDELLSDLPPPYIAWMCAEEGFFESTKKGQTLRRHLLRLGRVREEPGGRVMPSWFSHAEAAAAGAAGEAAAAAATAPGTPARGRQAGAGPAGAAAGAGAGAAAGAGAGADGDAAAAATMPFGMYMGERLDLIPYSYVRWMCDTAGFFEPTDPVKRKLMRQLLQLGRVRRRTGAEDEVEWPLDPVRRPQDGFGDEL
ncbi:hypothetical protein HXX76_001551 [Chlamydomonas incerta]|uniref:O-fucosyltransferase family protein n=1 Tax=Chlamydomonas incerta TaxID=51695 RepID=A0A835WCB1_CHLIN|nr:hypothetical protein HXX76_001551 [Chlamydomonas incerta]|eukprot:KAG2444809.1 hypothetical protein HXX76_001551 [Chlamydomonas incerta]